MIIVKCVSPEPNHFLSIPINRSPKPKKKEGEEKKKLERQNLERKKNLSIRSFLLFFKPIKHKRPAKEEINSKEDQIPVLMPDSKNTVRNAKNVKRCFIKFKFRFGGSGEEREEREIALHQVQVQIRWKRRGT